MYYVYKHIRLKDNSIFYIGKGKGERLYSADKRNNYWKRIVDKDGGFRAELITDNLSENEAFDLEKSIISKIGLENLSNITEGGTGGNTRKGFTQDEYDEWIKNKSIAQTGKVGYWKDKKRDNHSNLLKDRHANGSYDYKWLSRPKADETKKLMSESASNRIRVKVKCEKCGKEIPNTHLARHLVSKNCKTN
jgi:RNA polymerase-binding transcription factor DksA